MKKIIISLLVAVFLFGCSNGTGNNPNVPDVPNVPETPAVKLPGKFSATVLSDAIGSKARGISLGTYTVANSKSIYFLLRNVGDFPITDIALTPGKLNKDGGAFVPITDNGITASPGTIAVLETSGNSTVETVIEVDINHGNVVGLISQQYIQKADFAGTTLRITGKTRNEAGATLDISLDADIETLIKVCSFELRYSDDSGATYKKAGYDFPYPTADEPTYIIPYASRNHIKILNTGNVPLRYKVWKNGDQNWENYNEWVTLNAGEYSNVLQYKYSNGGNAFLIDTIGVAFDNNGMVNFIFRPNTSIIIDGFNPNWNQLYFYFGWE